MIDDEVAWEIFQALDELKGADLINSAAGIRAKFDLSEEDFASILKEWQEV